MLMYLVTMVTLTRSNEIYLGGTFTEFQKRLGIRHATGGDTASIRPTKEQLMQASAVHLTCNCSARIEFVTRCVIQAGADDKAVRFLAPLRSP